MGTGPSARLATKKAKAHGKPCAFEKNETPTKDYRANDVSSERYELMKLAASSEAVSLIAPAIWF